MSFHTDEGYAFLDKDPETGEPVLNEELRRLFLPDWLRETLEHSGADQAREFERIYWIEAAATLKRISESPENWLDRGVPVGTPKLKAGNKSIPVKELLLVGLAYSLPAYIAISALVAGPASLLLAAKAASAVGPVAAKYYTAVHTYTPTELDVHTAVAKAIHRNAPKVLKADGVTLDEIENSFEPQLIKPPDLKAVLDDMASDKKRMLLRSVAGGVEAFKPNPL